MCVALVGVRLLHKYGRLIGHFHFHLHWIPLVTGRDFSKDIGSQEKKRTEEGKKNVKTERQMPSPES